MSEYEIIDLPNGSHVCFTEESHMYSRLNPKTGKRGMRVAGVTTVTKAMDLDPSALLRWAAKTQCHGVAARYKMDPGGSWLHSGESIWNETVMHDLTYNDVRDAAATVGKNVHAIAFQALGMGRAVPDLDRLTVLERKHTEAIMQFWLDYSPEPEQVEQVVFSERLGVAGRLDFRGRLAGYEGVGVVDCKTGGYISAAAHTQVGGGYPLLADESGFGASDFALILKTYEDGSYDLYPALGTPADFELAVATYRASTRINREAAKAMKARKDAA